MSTDSSFVQSGDSVLLKNNKQQDVYSIKGRVIDGDQAPIDGATLIITEKSSSKIISTALSDTSGKFSLTVYKAAAYLLKIFATGVDSLTLNIVVKDSDVIELNDIILNASAKQLNGVTITGKRSLISQEADRIIYDLSADPESKVSSVLDMMRKVPYLSVDGNENILLKGSSGYRIFINGKPSAMVERHPKDVLRSIPASTVKSIEVITTPPPKYDAEGLAGIINIVTINKIDNGYRGSINVYEKGPVGGPGAGGAFTLKQNKIGLSALAGISNNNVPKTSGEITRTTDGINSSNLNQVSSNQSDSRTGYVGLEASYEPDTLNLFSVQFNRSNYRSTGLTTQTSILTGTTLQEYFLTNDKQNKNQGTDASINYQLGFKANKERLLTISYRYMKNTGSLLNSLVFSDDINYPNPDYRQSNEESLLEQTIQVDYVQPIGVVKMETGLKGIFRDNNSNYQYQILNPVTGVYELDDMHSNIFNNNQDIFAAYNSYEYKKANWQLRAGVRAEETIIQGEGSSQVKQKYLNLMPSVVANRKFKNSSSLSLSYSRRIQRPAIAQLNTFVDRSNPDFQTSGNPDLRPITSNALQLSYLKTGKATFNIALGYLFFSRVINPVSSYDPVSKVTITRYENYGRGSVIKTNIYLNYAITHKWSVSLNSDLRYVVFYSLVNNVTIKNTGSIAYVNVSSNLSIGKNWSINGDFTLNTGGVSSQGKTNGFIASSFSVNKDIFKKKLTLSAAVSNPFSKYRNANERIIGPDFLQTNDYQLYFRRFTASCNFRFGELEGQIKKNKRGIKNDDLSSN